MDSIEQLIEKLERDLSTMTGAQAAATQGLIDSLKRSQRSFGFFDRYLNRAGSSADDFADYVDRGSESADVFGSVLRDSSRREKNRVQQMSNAAQNFVQGTLSNLERLGQGSGESASTLQSAAKLSADAIGAAMDGIKGIAGAIAPGIGSAIVGIFTETTKVLAQAGSALVGFYAGQMEGLRSQQKKFYEAGVQFSNGIDSAGKIIEDSNLLTIGDLASAAEKARDSLRLMAGGSAGGLTRLTNGFKQLSKAQIENLYALGYSNDEILAGMADFAASAERNGKALDAKQLAEQSMKYLTSMRELERLTGKSIASQKSQQEANSRSLFVQNQLADLAGPQRAATEKFLSTIDPLMQDVALTGRGMTKDSALMASRLPTYAAGIADITARLKTGAIDDIRAGEEYKKLMNDPRVAAEIRDNQKTFGNVVSDAMGNLGGFVTKLGELQAELTGNIQQAKADTPKPDEFTGPLQEGINTFVLETKRMENTFQNIALQVTGALQPAIQSMIDGFRGVAETLGVELPLMVGEVNSASLAATEISRLSSDAKQNFGLTGNVKYVGGGRGSAPTASFEYQIKADILEKAKQAGISYEEMLSKMIKDQNQAQQIQTQAQQDQLRQDQINFLTRQGINELRAVEEGEITKALEQNNTVLAERLKVEKDLYDFFDSNTNKLQKFNVQSDNNWDWNDAEKFKLPGRAKGAIVPKNPPVGVVQRMSEAGDEAIMPLSRASGGDLGVKVTGQMIDGSTLMKNLLDVNKNQAALMAGLNSKIDGMNSTFEKLVYEQRQANRLAV
jgi:hypothetical protein